MPRIDNFIEIESGSWAGGVGNGETAHGYGISFCGNNNVLKLVVPVFVQLCE